MQAQPRPCSLKAALTELQQPALAVRVEESMREVVPVVFRDFEGLVFYALMQVLGQRVTLHVSDSRKVFLPSPFPSCTQKPAGASSTEDRGVGTVPAPGGAQGLSARRVVGSYSSQGSTARHSRFGLLV